MVIISDGFIGAIVRSVSGSPNSGRPSIATVEVSTTQLATR
jgi:hypothetical protein